MRYRSTIATLVALSAAATASADDLPLTGPLPLAEVVAYARTHNPELVPARSVSAGAAERYAAGTGGQPDALRADVERTHIATRLVTTRLAREGATARLNELLSRPPDATFGTPVDPGPQHVPGPLDRLI